MAEDTWTHTNSFLVSTIIKNNIFHKPTTFAGGIISTDIYIADFGDFHFLLVQITTNGNHRARLLILPKKFTDKYENKVWDEIIDDFFKIVQGGEKAIREGKPLGATTGVEETRQDDGTITKNPNDTPTQGHMSVGAGPINEKLYKEFLEKYS